jgi:single-stranded DNA-binding protein
MTVFALVTGTIFRAPLQKTSKAGKPYTVCTVKAGSDDSASGDFWSVLIFSESAQLEMLRLEIGDAVAIRGKLEIKTYVANDGTTKISRSIFADAALGLRPAPRTQKPKVAKPAPMQEQSTTTTDAPPETAASGPAFFSDDIPFLMEWRG